MTATSFLKSASLTGMGIFSAMGALSAGCMLRSVVGVCWYAVSEAITSSTTSKPSVVPRDGDGVGPRAVGPVQVVRMHQEGHHLEAVHACVYRLLERDKTVTHERYITYMCVVRTGSRPGRRARRCPRRRGRRSARGPWSGALLFVCIRKRIRAPTHSVTTMHRARLNTYGGCSPTWARRGGSA